jgi:mannosyltransferase
LSLYKLASSPMWSDETASVSISVQHGHGLWSAVASDGGSMSAYYLLLHTLFLAGLGQSAVSVRLVSVVAFVVMVPFLYGLVRRCWGTQVAVIATALVITNRMVISKAQEARGYALGLLLVVVAAWLLSVAVDRLSRPRLVAWAVVSALACYSLLLSPLFAVAQFVSLGTLRRRPRLVRSAVIAVGVVAVLVVPLGLMALHRGTGQIDWIAPISAGSVKGFLYGLIVPWFSTWLRWLMLVVIFVGIVQTVREAVEREAGSLERWHRVMLLCWGVLPLVVLLAISFSVSLLQSDYLIASVPAFAVLAALGITTIARWAGAGAAGGIAAIRAGEGSRSRRGPAPAGLVLAAALAGLIVVYPLVDSWGRYGAMIENGPGETALVVGLARPGDAIIFDQPAQRMIFNYYLLAGFDTAGKLPLLPAPAWPSTAWGTQLPYAADHRVPTPAAIAALDGRFSRIWVVDGGWAPLPRYLAQSRAMLAALGQGYPVVGEEDFRGVKVLLFSKSGPRPPGMHAWTGGG